MNVLDIQTEGSYLNYYAGGRVKGHASWRLDSMPTEAEIRLFWYTQGKGTSDTETVQIEQFASPGRQEERFFDLQIPLAPFSYSGRIVSVLWALELVIQPGNVVHRQAITVSSTGYEIKPGELR